MGSPSTSRWLRRGAIAAVAVAFAILATISLDGEGEPGSGAGADAGLPEPQESRVVSPDELGELAAEIGYPVYWAGEIEDHALRVEIQEGGNVLVSYPPADSAEDFPIARALVIGSYPLADPAGALAGLAEEEGADVHTSESGRLVVMSGRSAYFADPDGGVQIEVYAPRAREARRLALSDDVRPVD